MLWLSPQAYLSMTSPTSKQSLLNVALADAASKGNSRVLPELLLQGADPKAFDSRPLLCAAFHGNAECVRLLIPVSDLEAEESAALHWAAHNGHAECVKLLIPASNPKAAQSQAIRAAARNGHAECVRLLIPASIPLRSLRIRKAFLRAIEDGHAGVVALMLSHEPRLLQRLNLSKLSLEAAKNGHAEVASLLLSAAERRSLASSIQAARASPRSLSSSRL